MPLLMMKSRNFLPACLEAYVHVIESRGNPPLLENKILSLKNYSLANEAAPNSYEFVF